MVHVQHPSLVRQPQTFKGLLHGVNQLGDLLALTLGPSQGVIVSSKPGAVNAKPEILVDSGVIARRVVELPERTENVGAMLLRNLAWTMHEQYGDGAATASVLAQAMLNDARKVLMAGANAMLLRRGIEIAVDAARESLTAQACPITSGKALGKIATAITDHAELGTIMGEMFDILGKNGAFIVEEFAAPYLDREYVEGGRWTARPGGRALMPPGKERLILENPLIVVTDEKPEKFEDVARALQIAAAQKRPLLIVSDKVSEQALQALTLNHTRGALTVASAVVTSSATQLSEDLEDIALLSGAVKLSAAAGRPVRALQPEWMGSARRIILTFEALTVIGGQSDAAAIQKHTKTLQARAAKLNRNDSAWDRLRLRVARLTGGVGILKVGAYTNPERDSIKERAKKAARVLAQALDEGLVPGGGAAYLEAARSLDKARQACQHEDELYGVELVANALAAPFLQIVRNHGRIHPPSALADVRSRGAGWGYDAVTGDYAHMADIGVMDSLSINRAALDTAASTAIMAMTTDVVVLMSSSRQQISVKP